MLALLEGGMSKDSRQGVEVSVARYCQYRRLLQLESLVVSRDPQLRRPRQATAP